MQEGAIRARRRANERMAQSEPVRANEGDTEAAGRALHEEVQQVVEGHIPDMEGQANKMHAVQCSSLRRCHSHFALLLSSLLQ